jgi:hypothetical protein
MVVLASLVLVVAAGCAPRTTGDSDTVGRDLAQAYGVDGFHQVEELQFTFNAQVGERSVSRRWIWKPHTGEVTFGADGRGVTFSHPLKNKATNDEIRALDAKFVNDRYWLLFPLHLVWDASIAVTDHGQVEAPLGAGRARRLEVRYPPAGGYTPGDVYELFVGRDGRIVAWIYRRGGAPAPTRMSTWEMHRRLGPLWVSLDHRGPDGFRVWFTDVALKHVNGEGRIYPAE